MKVLALAVAAAFGLPGAAMACPDFNLRAVEAYSASGAQLRQPRSFNVVAGGENFIGNCPNVQPGSDRGAGFFTTSPDFSFELSGMGGLRLSISAISECDSALLINTASTGWFYDDDDNGNLDPKIVLTRPANGRIDVWVGTYDGELCNARLTLESAAR